MHTGENGRRKESKTDGTEGKLRRINYRAFYCKQSGLLRHFPWQITDKNIAHFDDLILK
jgi:hypothetical protein